VFIISKEISFEEAYAEASRESIKILGSVVSKIVTDYLQGRYSIDITKTANNPAALDEALEHAIDGGRTIVERKLLNLLYEKLNLEPFMVKEKNKNLSSFEQKVNEVKQRYSTQV
jgi:hypothetical protein